MSDPTNAPVKGQCADCGARFRIPDPTRVYPCKKCGGEVRALDLIDELDELVECPSCGADNEGPAQFCDACGEPLSEAARADREDERRTANADLRLARRRVGQLKFFFRLFGVIALVVALLILSVALAATGGAVDLGGEVVDAKLLWLSFAIQMSVAVVLLVASVRIERKPFFWALIVAALQTVDVALGVLVGSPSIFGILLAVLYWGGVAAVAPVERIIEEHPDLAGARRFRGEVKKRSGTVRARHQGRKKGEWGPRLIAIGGVAALLAVLGVGYSMSQRKPGVDDTIESFLVDWRESGLPELAEYFEPDEREAYRDAFVLDTEVRGWTSSAPGPGREVDRVPRGEGAVSVSHAFEGAVATSHWQYDTRAGEWYLKRLDLPAGQIVDRLIAAWNRGDVDAVARFFRAPYKGESALASLARRHGWDPLPEIVDPEIERASDTRTFVRFQTPRGPARLSIRRGAERWYLSSVKPPPRDGE